MIARVRARAAVGGARMAISIDTVGVIGAGQMGTGIALVCAQAGNERADQRHRPKSGSQGALATINGNLSRHIAKGGLRRGRAQGDARAHRHRRQLRRARQVRHRVIEAASESEDIKRKIFGALRKVFSSRRNNRRLQHLVDFHHPPRLDHRASRALHRHPLHEPGAAHPSWST